MNKCDDCGCPVACCPFCSKSVHLQTENEHGERLPSAAPGDCSVCMGCSAYVTINATMDLELMSREDIDAMPKETLEQFEFLRREVLQRWRKQMLLVITPSRSPN